MFATPDPRHRRATALFADACDCPTEERDRFLDEACGDDDELRREVESLLAHRPPPKVRSDVSPSAETATLLQPADGEPPAKIGPYRLLTKLGEGGMGEVWEAEQESPVRRRVALKLIKWGMTTREAVARFESERQALALMDHPAIAKVFDAGTTPEGRPYFAMELVTGVPITGYCETHRLTTDQRLALFMEVCQGVQHAHQKGIIHRDLKPSNILVTLTDGKPTPKIIDFGVAKATAQRLSERTVFTRLGQWIGTPEYMSPEQAEMSGLDVDTRTDVYSLGAVLYELLAGAQPFDGRELRQAGFDEMRRRIREEEPPPPSSRVTEGDPEAAARRHADRLALARELRGDLDWITMKALEKDPGRRYGSPSELAADLARHLHHEPVAASPPSALYRFRKLFRRHLVGMAAATSAAVALVLGLAFALLGLGWARQAQVQAQHEAAQAREQSRKAENLARAMIAEDLVDDGETTRGSLLALEMRQPDEAPVLVAALHQAVAAPVELLTLRGHTDWVSAASFNGDGSRVVTASGDKTARIWDARTGAEIAVLEGHTGLVWTAEWNADASRIVTASGDGTARIWDAETGHEILTLEGHEAQVGTASWSGDGSRVLTASGDATARIWDAAPGRATTGEAIPLVGHRSEVLTAEWSGDGLRVVTASEDATARIWDATTGAEIHTLGGHESIVSSASWSDDSSRVLTTGGGTARIWDSRTGAELTRLKSETSEVSPMFWSGDGTWLVEFSRHGTMRIWNAAPGRATSGEEITLLTETALPEGHTNRLLSASWNGDASRIVTTSMDGTARIWDAATGAEIVTLRGHEGLVWAAAWNGDASRIVTTSADNSARIWNVDAGAEIFTLRGEISGASWNGDDSRVVTASRDGSARIWDTTTGAELIRLEGHESGVTNVSWSGGGSRVLTSSYDGTVRIWDATTGAETLRLEGHWGAWMGDGSRVFTLSHEGMAWIWNATTGAKLLQLDGHQTDIFSVSWSGDGSRVLAASPDGTARIWDAKTGAEITRLDEPFQRTFGSSWSGDGSRVLAASSDATLRIWDATTGAEVVTLKVHGELSAVSWSGDGSRVATASRDVPAPDLLVATGGIIQIWDAATGAEMVALKGHTGEVLDVSWSGDGSRVLAAYEDGRARIWDATTGAEIATFEGHTAAVRSASWSGDGSRVLTVSDDGTARIWASPPDFPSLLLSRIRARTRLCLDLTFRKRTLGESAAAAERRAAACEACVPLFFDRLGDARPWEWRPHEEAWRGYEECLHAGT